MIDFFGPGYAVVEKMGLLPELETIHYPVESLTFINSKGAEKFSLAYPQLRKTVFNDHHFNFMRGELERVLFDTVQGKLSVHFGTTVESLQQHVGRVEVVLSDNSILDVDLLVGADGIHSRIRELAFGGESEFIAYLGYHAIAFTTCDPNLVSQVESRLYTLTVPGK